MRPSTESGVGEEGVECRRCGERKISNEILTERSQDLNYRKMAGLSGNKENPFGFRDDRFKLKQTDDFPNSDQLFRG